MLDLKYVTEHLDDIRAGYARRGFTDGPLLDKLSALAERRREAIVAAETQRAVQKAAGQEMAKADKKSPEFAARRDALKTLATEVKALESARGEVEAELSELMMHLPNLPADDAPDGLDERSNVVQREIGTKPSFDFTPKDHVDLGVALDILDFERATKVSGARFVVLKGLGSRLERALLQFMLDTHVDEHGYTEIWPPAIVKDDAMRGTSQLPKFAKDAFRIAKDEEWEEENKATGHDLYLIPTAEVPVTNLHADEILEHDALPVAYAAYTPCFRSEAGSYGKDTRGMIRQHQFDKVELVRLCAPEDAEAQHELLTSHAEAILQKLGLAYRVVKLCAGDMGFAAKRCYDLEVWLPGQSAYREISSCSWFGDFQARRMNARFRPAPNEKPRLLHTINGSALAIGRTLVAILEQYQQADGSIVVPEVLRPYMGGHDQITRA